MQEKLDSIKKEALDALEVSIHEISALEAWQSKYLGRSSADNGGF